MEAHVTRIVLIGPEASGKTTLARELASAFGAPWTPEAARLYAEQSPEPLSLATVGPIARLSMRMEDAALGRLAAEASKVRSRASDGAPLLFRDTDLVSTVIYSRHYYGTVDEWIVREARTRRADLYLLCRPDLPWLPDGVRDRPLHRARLFEDFLAELLAMEAHTVEISGTGETRRQSARAAVEELLTIG